MRYESREVVPVFELGKYGESLKKRGAKVANIYTTPVMHHLTNEQVAELNPTPHTWKMGDKFYKLAFEHYGDASIWWVIAWYNKKPTDANLMVGETIYIPHPIEEIMAYYR